MQIHYTMSAIDSSNKRERSEDSALIVVDQSVPKFLLLSPVKKRSRLSLAALASIEQDTSASNKCELIANKTTPLSSSLQSESPPKSLQIEIPTDCSPDVYVQRLLRSNGYDSTSRPASSLTGFFEEPTEAQINAYDATVVTAVRDEDLDTLRNVHGSGRTLQCCNRFGESLTHMACRRGFVDVAKFLLEEVNVSTRVKDDYGRTVLHDACWSSQPRFELVELLIKRDPDLLLISDARGFVPFKYVRREHWGQWIEFLSERKHLIRPRQFNFTTATCA